MCPSSTSSSELASGAAERDGLIQAPETFGGGRLLLFAVVAVFLGAIVGTGLIDTFFPRKRPELIGDEKTRDDQVRASATLLDGSLARLIEDDLRITSKVRRKVTPPYAWFLYRHLHEAKDLIVGREGWLFLHSRARGPVPSAAAVVQRSANQLAALDRLLHSRGVQLVAAPIPRKAVVLAELLPRGVNPVREVEESLVAELRSRGVPTADLLSAFEGTDPRRLFHLGDSHWTGDAEILAAEEIAEVGGFRVPPQERQTELRTVEDAALGRDLFRWIGADIEVGTEPFLQQHRRDKYEVYRADDGSQVRRRNPKEVGRIALAGTSFSARRHLPVLLSHCSGETVWNAAKPGEGPMKPLRDFLASLQDQPWPEVLVLEFPVHLVMGGRGMHTVSGIFSDWAPPSVAEVLGTDSWKTWGPKSSRGRKWARIAQLPEGKLGHSGDGCVSLRLTGRAKERVELQIDNGGLKLEYSWAPDRSELVVPLATQSATAGAVTLALRSNKLGKLSLDELEVVAPLRSDALAEGVLAAPGPGPEPRWAQEVSFPGGALVPDQAVLRLQLSEERIKGRFLLEVSVEGTDGPVRTFAFRSLAADAQVILGLDGLAGERLTSVRLLGAGKPPEACLVSARLHAPGVGH